MNLPSHKLKIKIRKITAEGVNLDIVVLDYIDCVIPDRSFNDEWKGEGSVMRKFEGMCHELNLVGWTAAQGNRSSISSEVVTTDQMGGSIKESSSRTCHNFSSKNTTTKRTWFGYNRYN